jgi:hypothetical protein
MALTPIQAPTSLPPSDCFSWRIAFSVADIAPRDSVPITIRQMVGDGKSIFRKALLRQNVPLWEKRRYVQCTS